MSHKAITVITVAFILFVLIGDDFRLALMPKSADDVFNFITIIAMAVFTIEIIIYSVCQ